MRLGDIPSSRVGDQASAYAEVRAWDAQAQARARTKLDDAKRKVDIEDLLAEIQVMYKEIMALQRRKFQLKQKLFAFQFAPEISDEGSVFDLESIAAHRLKLLQGEIRKG